MNYIKLEMTEHVKQSSCFQLYGLHWIPVLVRGLVVVHIMSLHFVYFMEALTLCFL